MDLLDLYHAADHHFASSDNETDVVSVHKIMNNTGISQMASAKMKKPRFVPWEPFRAAPSADRKGEAPADMPKLIPYPVNLVDENSNKCSVSDEHLVDTRRSRAKDEHSCRSEKEIFLEKQLVEMKSELEIERKLNAELKRLMVAAISDELQGQVEALSEDKIRLAHRVEEYTEKMIREDEQFDQLLIDRDVWKCKFLAQSIRTDELNIRSEFLLGMLRDAQRIVKQMCDGASSVSKDAAYFANLDLTTFFIRSPCEERVRRKVPNYTNVTISCCPKCFGREIHLL